MGVITKGELEKKYYSMDNRDLAKELDISVVTLLKLIDTAEIKRKGQGYRYNRSNVKMEVIG